MDCNSQNSQRFNTSKNITWVIVFIFILCIFFVLKYQSPSWIETSYRNNKIDLLNSITGSSGTKTLDFYLGRGEEAFLGPLTQIISGLLFAAIALLYLRGVKLWVFGAAIFIYLVLTKLEVLFFPPYGDAVGGPFAEAIWLARHSFDYAGLFKQLGYAFGGPKVYMFSVFPTFLALLLKAIPFPKAFLVVTHLLVFGFAATVVTLFKSVLSKVFREDLSILVSLFLLSLPLFQSQTEAINMEMPCVFFVMLSAYFLINKKIHKAGIMAICSVLVKGTGIVSCAAFLVIGLFLFFGKTGLRFNKKFLVWGILLPILALAKVLAKFLITDQHVSAGMLTLGSGWASLDHMHIFYYYVYSLILFLGFLIYKRFIRKKSEWHGFYETCVMFVYGGMWFLLFLNFSVVSPRYRVVAYPFVVFCGFAVFSLVVRYHWLRKIVVVAALAVALFSSYGYFYHEVLPSNYHILLERSLEYRNDLKVDQKLVRVLQEKYANFKIGAPLIIAQFLAIPELGYVEKGRDVMIYGFHCNYGGVKNFPGLRNIDIPNTVYIAAQVDRSEDNFSYPISSYDKIIDEVQYGNQKIWLFMGGVGIEKVFQFNKMLQLKKLGQNP